MQIRIILCTIGRIICYTKESTSRILCAAYNTEKMMKIVWKKLFLSTCPVGQIHLAYRVSSLVLHHSFLPQTHLSEKAIISGKDQDVLRVS